MLFILVRGLFRKTSSSSSSVATGPHLHCRHACSLLRIRGPEALCSPNPNASLFPLLPSRRHPPSPSLLPLPPCSLFLSPGRNLELHEDVAMVAAQDLRALESHQDVVRIKNAAEAGEEPAGDRRTHRFLPRRPPVGIFYSDHNGLPRA